MTTRTATHTTTDRSSLDKTSTAALQKSRAKGGWTFVVTDWTGEFFGTRGLVKVASSTKGAPTGSTSPRSSRWRRLEAIYQRRISATSA